MKTGILRCATPRRKRQAAKALRHAAASMCDVRPDVILRGHTFCFTGRSARMNRDDMEGCVSARGGTVQHCVSAKTDFLIVCGMGSTRYKYGAVGNKLMRAIDLRRAGSDIQIVREVDFWRACG